MRISDWSSDVCSSDLQRYRGLGVLAGGNRCRLMHGYQPECGTGHGRGAGAPLTPGRVLFAMDLRHTAGGARGAFVLWADRQRVVEGKRVAVSVISGGRRNIKKTNINTILYQIN